MRAMTHEHHQIGAAAARLAARLPHSLAVGVADAVARYGSLERAAARQAILHHLPTPDFREATAEFIDLWHATAGGVGAEAVAVALVTAATCEHAHRHGETVEVVWTVRARRITSLTRDPWWMARPRTPGRKTASRTRPLAAAGPAVGLVWLDAPLASQGNLHREGVSRVR